MLHSLLSRYETPVTEMAEVKMAAVEQVSDS